MLTEQDGVVDPPSKSLVPMQRNQLSYRARRLGMLVEASVEEDVVHWRYVTDGDEWKQSVPLTNMIPHPMFSIDRGTRWKYIAILVVIPILAFGLTSWFNLGATYMILVPVVLFVVLAVRFSSWLLGPIEWATFDTMLKDKTVYFFCGAVHSEFDEFVTALDRAIQSSRGYVPKMDELDDRPKE